MPPSISLEEGNDFVNRMRMVIKDFPEIETVVSQQGRPDDGTDATGFFNAEFSPRSSRQGMAQGHEQGQAHRGGQLKRWRRSFPGVGFNFSQYIQDNVEEAVSGVKGENSVKLIGNDLVVLTETAEKIKDAMSKVRGVADLAVFTSLGQPTLRIDIDRKRAARYGLAPGDINADGSDRGRRARPPATSTRTEATGTSRWSFGWRRNIRQNLETISSLTIAAQDPTTNKGRRRSRSARWRASTW